MASYLSSPQLIKGEIMHKRFSPKENSFNYQSLYIAFPISQCKQLKRTLFSIGKFNLFSFNQSDYGEGKSLYFEKWIHRILTENNITDVAEIVLVTHPRILGYVFNPVSFWLCFNRNDELIAVLSEVTNTTHQKHHYLCYKANLAGIQNNDWLEADKKFYVSPFMEIEGKYQFRFEQIENNINFFINYMVNDKIKLSTYLKCDCIKLTNRNLLLGFLRIPLATLKTTMLIHYQAIKLLLKSLKYHQYPKPLKNNLTIGKDEKKDL